MNRADESESTIQKAYNLHLNQLGGCMGRKEMEDQLSIVAFFLILSKQYTVLCNARRRKKIGEMQFPEVLSYLVRSLGAGT